MSEANEDTQLSVSDVGSRRIYKNCDWCGVFVTKDKWLTSEQIAEYEKQGYPGVKPLCHECESCCGD